MVAGQVAKGRFPDVVPGVAMDMIYTADLACDRPVTGPEVAAAFTRVLGRPIRARPFLPAPVVVLLPLLRPFVSAYLRDQIDVFRWIRRGGYVSRHRDLQRELFGPPPSVRDSVRRYSEGIAPV